ncbi:hypothetical protein DERF_014592 [Dermatophagoides farinae]|uniref:Uncharacterized protein n=1 Tax=Dermatophagoides farinae TaxID=6954 RepID=A0A922HIR4_DERFA|nr:hypothetical protein DERF_014592 [Dermatophagoides farinae]
MDGLFIYLFGVDLYLCFLSIFFCIVVKIYRWPDDGGGGDGKRIITFFSGDNCPRGGKTKIFSFMNHHEIEDLNNVTFFNVSIILLPHNKKSFIYMLAIT